MVGNEESTGMTTSSQFIGKEQIPERNSLPFEDLHLMGVSGDERGFAEELLLRNGPEIATREVLRRRTRLQVVLPVQPSQPKKLAVTMQRVSSERQRKRGGGHDPRRGQNLCKHTCLGLTSRQACKAVNKLGGRLNYLHLNSYSELEEQGQGICSDTL